MLKQYMGFPRAGRCARAAALLVSALFVCAAALPASAKAQTAAAYGDSGAAADWIVKSVCADGQNRPVAADPYYDCPPGTARRKIALGDPLPYHNVDQTNSQQSDAYPILDPSGNTLYFQSFDFAPFNEFNLTDGSDGYDAYSLADGWFSAAGTRDGGGYGQEFFGNNCALGDGWIFFPTSGFLSGGSTEQPIAGSWWEQSRGSYPGACPGAYSRPTTSWELKKNYPFGSVGGNPVKYMDTMVSYHGFDPSSSAPQHLEVFYYTEQYGKTKWEAWTESSLNPQKTASCIEPDTVSYMGHTFVVTDCRDWSAVTLASSADIPQWPVSAANVLSNSHFADDASPHAFTGSDLTEGYWHYGGVSKEGNLISWSLQDSTAARDTRLSALGVRYLALSCGGTCSGSAVQEFFQDVPISRIHAGSYLFGAFARTAPGSSAGTLRITLQEIDGSGRVLWQDYADGTVSSYNGTVNDPAMMDSVYLSSAFIHKMTSIPILSGAAYLRYYLTPMTGQTFDVVDTWLNPFPSPGDAFGASAQPLAPTSCGLMAVNTMLTPGESVSSCNGTYRLIFQTDGNLVLYDSGGRAIWNTGTWGRAASSLAMQADGNLVLYNGSSPLWALSWNGGTYGAPAHLAVQDGGNVVVYRDSDNAVMWQTHTAR